MESRSLFLVAMVVGALAIVAYPIIEIQPQQHADARGCNNGIAFNASQGRCFGH